jgi:hypothetical protein
MPPPTSCVWALCMYVSLSRLPLLALFFRRSHLSLPSLRSLLPRVLITWHCCSSVSLLSYPSLFLVAISYSLSLSSISYGHTRTYAHIHTHTLSNACTCSHSQTLTYTHTHTLSLSLVFSLGTLSLLWNASRPAEQRRTEYST